jgi:shikimate 5-dehydrogenase/3-dehydroquinate dehydratase
MIILTIPFKDNNSFISTQYTKADYSEYRLDYCPEPLEIDWGRFSETDIITIRDIAEGGVVEIRNEDKLQLISLALSKTQSIIDCEYRFLKRNTALRIPPDRLIISVHTAQDSLVLIKEFLHCTINALYYKLAVSCQTLSQFNEVLKLVPADKRDRIILVPAYPGSITVRLAYQLYGSLAAYAFWKESVTANQPGMQLAELCRINTINRNTFIYGIVGGEQVINSLSVIVYNNWFKLHRQDSVFLPLVAFSPGEALHLINWLSERAKVSGLAITMPFKKQLARISNSGKDIVNCWIPGENLFDHTDETALRKAVEFLGIRPEMSVLILGTGATAETALKVLEGMRIRDIALYSRQRIHQPKPDKEQILSPHKHRFDLLVNCSPFGFDEADKLGSIPEFKALIDLPYGKVDSVLVTKAKQDNIPRVDGLTFWKWQAIAQAEFFGLEPGFKAYINSLDLHSLLQ